MPKRDSIDKIIGSYFACVTAEAFVYDGKVYEPKPLRVSPYIFRDFTCPASCAACCSSFSLDYLPRHLEKHPYRLKKRIVEFDGRKVEIFSDLQEDNTDYHCQHVNKENGRCGIHGAHPFSCDFELIRFMVFKDEEKPHHAAFFPDMANTKARPNVLTQKLYGRAHAMKRVDGSRGAKCEMLPPDEKSIAEVIRKLRRLKTWCEYFKLEHKVDRIIEYAETGSKAQPIIV